MLIEPSHIKTIEQFLEYYKAGQRLFTDLEFENGESFSGVDLSGTTFRNCCFCADFTTTNLTDCKFLDCNIKTSDFSHANLTRAQITGCAVESTEYKGAIITDLIFENNSAYGNTLGLIDFKRIWIYDE
ncbi:MAG TPA: pentapeptide repeat-containing protein [Chitinophagales bacterium]|nr:pentapeptide repeat-containing protein [Chitinophagales bacterium]